MPIFCWRLFAVLLAYATCLPATADTVRIALASTLDNSGLGAAMVAGFRSHDNCAISVVTTSSAHGLRLLANGDVAAALTHAPRREQNFLAQQPQHLRHEFAQTEFVLVGPATDPASIRGFNLPTALLGVAAAEALFLSRDDQSGTHDAELELWQLAQGAPPPQSDWYLQVGGHMAATLWQAHETGAYTLADTATLAHLQNQGLDLVALARNRPPLRNVYSILLPSDAPSCAQALAAWLSSAPGRATLTNYTIGGEQLFIEVP